AQFLGQCLARQPVVGKRRSVFGLLRDKYLDGVVAHLVPYIDERAVAPLPTSRCRPAEEWLSAVQNLGARVTSFQSVALAVEAQCAPATPDAEILVFGAVYCVAEAVVGWARYPDEVAAIGLGGYRIEAGG
ncbi:bifunctional tetrahydrofolate synthase/dihydrofolate synthase, partial [Pseudomonas syringae pv. tagetis]